MSLRFRTGPGVSPTTVPSDVTHLVLVLNGREQTKVVFSQVWLRSLSLLSRLKHTAVVLLGNESCDNSWTKPYMRTRGGPLDQVFLVYDSTEVDGRMVLQWPLGVATYVVFYTHCRIYCIYRVCMLLICSLWVTVNVSLSWHRSPFGIYLS